jgi:hypothetical protein
MLNCVTLAGLLAGFVWSSSASAQTGTVSERTNLANERPKQMESSVGAGPPETETLGQLGTLALAPRCPSAVENEIVVCARPDDDGFRLKPLPEKYKGNRLGKTLDIEIAPGVHINGLGLKLTF